MSFRTITFPVQMGRVTDRIALGVRVAVADHLRGMARTHMEGAATAGVPRETVAHKLGFDWMKSANANRLCRSVPSVLVHWAIGMGIAEGCGAADHNAAAPHTAGTGNGSALEVLPGEIALINMGGIKAVGRMEGREGALPCDVQLTLLPDGNVECTLVFEVFEASKPDGLSGEYDDNNVEGR